MVRAVQGTDVMQPIVAQMTPSDEQRPAIVAREGDVAVTAGAGAGKTRTLVARYLSLVAEGMPLRAIVAITFTKKAAREMRNRVRQEIRRYLDRDELHMDEANGDSQSRLDNRARWRRHYEALDAARIGTIHSLCGEILRHHPAAAGIDPRFETLDEGQLALMQAQAVDAALGWAADDPELAPLYSVFGERELQRYTATLLQRRLDVADAIHRAPSDLWTTWEPVLVSPVRAFLEDSEVQDALSALVALRTDGDLVRAAAAGDTLVAYLTAALAHVDAVVEARVDGDWFEVAQHLAPLRAHLPLNKGRKANWAPADPKALIRIVRDRFEASLEPLVDTGMDLALDRRLAQEIIPALLGVYENAVAVYERAKAERYALDFDDLESRALALLKTSTEARAYWQREIRAVLVDEFQDTNARQRELLDVLNGEDGSQGKLFIVGDGKQSIYRFRGADVTVFHEVQHEIETRGITLQLPTSYRAHRDLIACLNALLRPVLGEADPARPYIAPFAPLSHYREHPADGLQSPYVELQLTVGTKRDGALDRAAQVLCARLAALVEGGEILLEGTDEETGAQAKRSLNYGDVAILCRASTSFPTYEAALEGAGIPYLTIAGRGFYDRPEVRDLLNALTALADPTDDLALTGLLRSPAVGLSDMALFRLREAQREAKQEALWIALQSDDLAFLNEEADVARRSIGLIYQLHQRVGRTSVADILKAFLDRTAYRAALLRAGEARAANNVGKLLSDAQASGIVSVDAFLAYIAELRDVAPREGEARALASGAVQIMTVHQAKGLEFPVVVLGDASAGSRGPSGLLIDPKLGVVPPFTADRMDRGKDGALETWTAKSMAYQTAKARAQDAEAAEADRLLYVATTRARELLLINGIIGARKRGIRLSGWLEKLDSALHLSDAATDCDSDGAAVRDVALTLAGHPVRCTLYEPQAPLPSTSASSSPLQTLLMPHNLSMLDPVTRLEHPVDPEIEAADRDPPRRVWRVVPEAAQTSPPTQSRSPTQSRAPSWVVGELVHEALGQWSFPGDGGRDFYRWAAAEARNAGLTDDARIRNAVQRAARMLVRFQATDLYHEMDGAAQRFAEVPYSVLDDEGMLDTGIIDALWRDGAGTEGRWHLVEFKTDRIRDESDLERHLRAADYVTQVGRYVAAAARLLGRRPTPALCFLNVSGRVHVVTDIWGD